MGQKPEHRKDIRYYDFIIGIIYGIDLRSLD